MITSALLQGAFLMGFWSFGSLGSTLLEGSLERYEVWVHMGDSKSPNHDLIESGLKRLVLG